MKNVPHVLFPVRWLGFLAVMFSVSASVMFGQSPETRPKNNPYSPSPTSRPKVAAAKPVEKKEVAFVVSRPDEAFQNDKSFENVRPSVTQAAYRIAKPLEAANKRPTETYRIGTGDVLYVSVKNVQTGSGYFTVRPDGTIDFPLAGDDLVVTDLTAESAADLIASGIKILRDPIVEVKVRQYNSHRVTVAGLVENGGDKNLQREAMPLFAIRAEALVSQKATRVLINKGPGQTSEVHDLRDPKTEEILVFPGYTVEFAGEGTTSGRSTYFIGGAVASKGEKELTSGMTLSQAAKAAGVNGNPKKAVIRRRSDNGAVTDIELNLRAIREGKHMDPFLAAGDRVEIRN